VSTSHFLDLILPSGNYKSAILETITKEKYLISKKIHTSFLDLDEITPLERKMILKFIIEDLKEQNAAMERVKAAKR
jgi:hypothetical protein